MPKSTTTHALARRQPLSATERVKALESVSDDLVAICAALEILRDTPTSEFAALALVLLETAKRASRRVHDLKRRGGENPFLQQLDVADDLETIRDALTILRNTKNCEVAALALVLLGTVEHAAHRVSVLRR